MTVDEPLSPSTGGRRLIRRIRFIAGMGVAAAVFWFFGPWAAKPIDPRGPITLLMVDQGVVGMAELLGLGVIVSGLAVAISGAGCAERGPLAVAVGLATLAMRGSQMDSLILYRLTSLRPGQVVTNVFPVWGLIAETWLWLALIAVGFVVGRWVDSWFAQEGAPAAVRNMLRQPTDFRHAIGTIAMSALVAWFVVTYTVGSSQHPLQKGQIYFAIAVAFMLASLVSHWFFQRTSRVWLLLSVAIVATTAYVFGAPDVSALSAAAKNGSYLPLTPVTRPLPIEYASLGAVGALLEEDAMYMLRALFGFPIGDDVERDNV